VNGEQPWAIEQAYAGAMGDAWAKTDSLVARGRISIGYVGLGRRLRRQVLQGVVANGADVNFVKTHNMPGSIKGNQLIPKEFTRSAIYVIRNPLDVVLSYARHFGRSHAHVVGSLANKANNIAPTQHTVPQFLGRWDDHVKGWTARSEYPTLVLRYEDMLSDPEAQFSKLLDHVGIPVDGPRLKKAVEFSSFKELSSQENTQTFEEKSEHARTFFSKGEAGQWKTDLDADLVKKIKADHGRTMKKFGYLDE